MLTHSQRIGLIVLKAIAIFGLAALSAWVLKTDFETNLLYVVAGYIIGDE